MAGQLKKGRIFLFKEAYEKLVRECYERDEYTCQGCYRKSDLDRPHHKKKKSQGGDDTLENLTTLCIYCHAAIHGTKYIRPKYKK